MARGDEKGAFNGIQFAAGQGYPLGGLKTSLSDIKASGLDTQVLIGVKRQILFKSNATPGKSEIAADHDGGIGSFLILGNEQTHITVTFRSPSSFPPRQKVRRPFCSSTSPW